MFAGSQPILPLQPGIGSGSASSNLGKKGAKKTMTGDYTELPDGTWKRDHDSPPSLLQTLKQERQRLNIQRTVLPQLPTLSLTALLTRQFPEYPWLVDKLLPQGGVMGVAGEPGTAKTWLLLELAQSVATGRSFLGRFATQQGAVLLIDEENGEARLQRRLTRLINHTPDDCPVHIASMSGVNLSEEVWINSLHNTLAEIKPSLVIFDSLVRVHRGEENSAQDISRLFAVLTSFRHDFGCAIVFSHHLRKMGFIRDLGQRVRGSSDILAYVDSMLGLTKADTTFILAQFKNRDGNLMTPLTISVDDPTEQTTEIKVIGEVDEETTKKQQVKGLVIDALADGEKFREELLAFSKEAGISERTLAEALKEMETAKVIASSFEGRKKKYATSAVLQTMQSIYPLQGLQESHNGDGELTPEEKQALLQLWFTRDKPAFTLGQAQWFNMEALLYSTDSFIDQKRHQHTPALRQLLDEWSQNENYAEIG